MDKKEERCWKFLLENRAASAEDVALHCGVSKGYAQRIIDRIGSENWRQDHPVQDPERIRLLKQGIELTGGDRNRAYGDPWTNLSSCATMWEAYVLAKHNVNVRFLAEDVAHLMQLVKMTRTFYGSYHADNYLDSAVYGAIAGECRQVEESLS